MIWESFKLSMLVVSIATVIVAVAGVALGYVLSKYNFRGRELLDSVLTLPMVLPPTVTGYYLILILGRQGILGRYIYDLTGWSVAFTWQAVVIAASVIALPLMIKSARAAIESVDAKYEIASYTLGKSPLQTFFLITLPLAKRGIIAGAVLSFARALGEFGATLVIAGNIPGMTQTMPLAIYEAALSGDEEAAWILAILLTAISIGVIYSVNKLALRN
ncbi:MAG: molybdate ABC transporter permease subunit [Deltaproteobacteria bacterium]